MEPNETGLSSYYHPHQPISNLTPTAVTAPTAANPSASPITNALLSNHANSSTGGGNPTALYPHSVVGKAPAAPVEAVRRKRGRPRKYGTPEAAAAAKRAASSNNLSAQPPKKKDQPFSGSSSKNSQSATIGNAGQGFTPHVINVAAGEDVGQKIVLFMQQTRREICILSASGSLCNVSLQQHATSGGNVTYEGLYQILTLSGSYVQTDLGERAGGLSACLSSPSGQIVGGGVGGPLIAAGPVEVMVGTFMFDSKKDDTCGIKGDASASLLSSPVATTPTVGYRPVIESSGRFLGEDNHQNIGGTFMVQPQGMHVPASQSTDWRGSMDTRTVDYDFTGQTGHESPENGDYDQLPD
ncbi:hypothetical protein Ancab_000958 [Ancistrocladus abbreviatus]